MRGHLYFKYGCMASGKSMQLLALAHHFQDRGIQYLIMKPSIDNRDGENTVFSRALGAKECFSLGKYDDVFKLISTYVRNNEVIGGDSLKWILVDESQFLTTSQVDGFAEIVDNLGINVICYGLRTDFMTHLFEGSKRLFEIADKIEEIKSSCYCNHKAIFNARIDSDKNLVLSGDQVEIGGDDKYVSLCRKCYYDKVKEIREKFIQE